LRFEPPLLQINRTATRAVEIAGAMIPEGASVSPWLGPANHDETRWESPEEFDIFRPPIAHLAFAHGPHMCRGMHLARLEIRTLINRVLDRLPNLALDPGDTDPHIRGLIFRSPTSLPVRFYTA
jgi:cytochrome P450